MRPHIQTYSNYMLIKNIKTLHMLEIEIYIFYEQVIHISKDLHIAWHMYLYINVCNFTLYLDIEEY